MTAPFQRGSRTSRLAARSQAESAPPARLRVLDFIRGRASFGATRDEIMAELHLGIPTVCGRVDDLLKAKLVYDTGAVRLTASGRRAAVLRARAAIPLQLPFTLGPSL